MLVAFSWAMPAGTTHGAVVSSTLFGAVTGADSVSGVKYGSLGERPETRDLMARVVREAYAVMTALDLPRLWPTPEGFLRVFYERLLPPTADHTPSMLQDIRAAKRTEIDALNGAIVTLGRSVEVETPINAMVSGLVRFLETQRFAN
jgi:2-dehydropantoate 2-reductase